MTQEQTPTPDAAPDTTAPEAPAPEPKSPIEEAIAPGYAFEGPALELGGLMTRSEEHTSELQSH